MKDLSYKLLLLSIVTQPCFAEKWSDPFQDLISPDMSVVDAARTRAFDVLIPLACTSSKETSLEDFKAISPQLENDNPRIRMQASGALFLIARCRTDSASLLDSDQLMKHTTATETSSRIRINSVQTLGSLNPAIPPSALRSLVTLTQSDDSKLAGYAAAQLAFSANKQPAAAESLAEAVQAAGSAIKTIDILHVLAQTKVSNTSVVQAIGELLERQDAAVVHEALLTLKALGPQAASVNKQSLNNFIGKGLIPSEVPLAQSLLSGQS